MTRSSTGLPRAHAKILAPLAAGAALISARSASAQFVAGDANLTLTSGTTGGFDVNNDGTNDFNIMVASDNTTKPQISTGGIATGVAQNQFVPTVAIDFGYGTPVDSSSSYGTPENLGSGSTYIGYTLNGTAGSGSELYGWAQFNYDSTNNIVTVGDFAYDETPGQGILAGEEMSSVPEPADTALMFGAAALLAGSAAIWRKRERAGRAAA